MQKGLIYYLEKRVYDIDTKIHVYFLNMRVQSLAHNYKRGIIKKFISENIKKIKHDVWIQKLMQTIQQQIFMDRLFGQGRRHHHVKCNYVEYPRLQNVNSNNLQILKFYAYIPRFGLKFCFIVI